MPTKPDIAVVVSTFERPWHLERCLGSLRRQRGVDGRFEVVVTDDGSRDETAEVVDRLAGEVDFPLRFVTQPQEGFRLAKCRNAGVRVSTAPYLLFTDGDCLLPPDHLAKHAAARRGGVARAGDCLRLERAASEGIGLREVATGAFVRAATRSARYRMLKRGYTAIGYQAIGHRLRPKLVGANIGVWRADFERVNGFDESFVGWGGEDDDFADRLRRVGVKIRTILHQTLAYHLWHPPHATTPSRWRDGQNVARLTRRTLLAKCMTGFRKRSVQEIAVRVMNRRCRWFHAVWPNSSGANASHPCELQLLVLPGDGAFRGNAESRVILAPDDTPIPMELERQSDLVIRTPTAVHDPAELCKQLEHALTRAA